MSNKAVYYGHQLAELGYVGDFYTGDDMAEKTARWLAQFNWNHGVSRPIYIVSLRGTQAHFELFDFKKGAHLIQVKWTYLSGHKDTRDLWLRPEDVEYINNNVREGCYVEFLPLWT